MEVSLSIKLFQKLLSICLILIFCGCSIDIDFSTGSSNSVGLTQGIHHVVFLKFKEVADLEECMGDSDRMIGSIPSGRNYFCGVHVETGRDTIVSDYDCAIVIGFDNEAGYKEYLEHPNHVDFAKKWKPRLEWIRSYDISM